MTEHSRKDQLLTNLTTNFDKLALELDTLPPVLQNNATIPAHVDKIFIDACQLVTHLAMWTECALRWVSKALETESLDLLDVDGMVADTDELSKKHYNNHHIESFKQARSLLNNSTTLLIGKIAEATEDALFTLILYENLTTGELINRYINQLYKEDFFRLRVWKKGLGWI